MPFHPDPDKAWMLANIDREVVGTDEVQILECKTAGEFGARLWRDGVPEYVQIQVQHQLAVTGKQAADVAVLMHGQNLQIHRIERDEALITKLIELEAKFWHYVQTDTPPPADGSSSASFSMADGSGKRCSSSLTTSIKPRRASPVTTSVKPSMYSL